MKIIVGLGNPGSKYEGTRHNVGFMAVDALARKYNLTLKKEGFLGKYSIGRINNTEVMLFKPMTYMNLSGEAVKSVSTSKLEVDEDLLIISDDVNLDLGSIRLKKTGSSGGHNGLRSIIQNLDATFSRLRIGISPDGEIYNMSSFVLESFKKDERDILDSSLEKTIECIETWLMKGIKEAMNQYN